MFGQRTSADKSHLPNGSMYVCHPVSRLRSTRTVGGIDGDHSRTNHCDLRPPRVQRRLSDHHRSCQMGPEFRFSPRSAFRLRGAPSCHLRQLRRSMPRRQAKEDPADLVSQREFDSDVVNISHLHGDCPLRRWRCLPPRQREQRQQWLGQWRWRRQPQRQI
jgi:hypothetical protein